MEANNRFSSLSLGFNAFYILWQQKCVCVCTVVFADLICMCDGERSSARPERQLLAQPSDRWTLNHLALAPSVLRVSAG